MKARLFATFNSVSIDKVVSSSGTEPVRLLPATTIICNDLSLTYSNALKTKKVFLTVKKMLFKMF